MRLGNSLNCISLYALFRQCTSPQCSTVTFFTLPQERYSHDNSVQCVPGVDKGKIYEMSVATADFGVNSIVHRSWPMSDSFLDKARSMWNSVADDWDIQVGDEGDRNRVLNSDPVLWDFVGDVEGLDVLDAGCGTGYLTRKLHEKGARVVGVDFSEEMIRIARRKSSHLDFRVESCSELGSFNDGSMDVVVSNYVLMDTPDLEETMEAFRRVLRLGGTAVVVFSHPCFPADWVQESGHSVSYRWECSYFERGRHVAPPWNHFKSEFIWFHRPLSDYWKAFRSAGFKVLEFEEPRLTEDRAHLVPDESLRRRAMSRPFSVAFKLRA